MYAFEKPKPGFETYSNALWWTINTVITTDNEFFPTEPEGKILAFLLAVFGYTVFGYVTASFASYLIGKDAENRNTSIAGSRDLAKLSEEIKSLKKTIEEINDRLST